ncbi:hypothetical protein [Candidatus Poriferisocius sp.]|uniref:hypothetical protein n=1 Tax=Candidatus Poriferisocius sp. TaxID=3101276 RepID=UPI003B52C7F2
MNTEKMLELADYIENEVEVVDMEQWLDPYHDQILDMQVMLEEHDAFEAISTESIKEQYDFCGTPACIAGHCVLYFEPKMATGAHGSIQKAAERILGLEDLSEANTIFGLFGNSVPDALTPPRLAAKYLREVVKNHLNRLDAPDWPTFIKDEIFANKHWDGEECCSCHDAAKIEVEFIDDHLSDVAYFCDTCSPVFVDEMVETDEDPYYDY